MSCNQTLDKLSEKFSSRLLVQEEHGFEKGAQCAPLGHGSSKKPGLDRVKATEKASRTTFAKDTSILGVCEAAAPYPTGEGSTNVKNDFHDIIETIFYSYRKGHRSKE